MKSSRQARSSEARGQGERLFAEVVGGIEEFAVEELTSLGATDLTSGRGGLRFRHAAPRSLLPLLNSVAAIYSELRFAVPRPKALLGDQALKRLAGAMAEVAHAGGMHDFRLAAAGSDSAVFRRLVAELERLSGLRHEPEEGGLLLRVRPYGSETEAAEAEAGWEVLLRLSERPLSKRSWRVCNRPGGINATVAYAMNKLLKPVPAGCYLNLMCGSGTLLIERARLAGARRLVGVDSEAEAVACARTNLAAAQVRGAELLTADVRHLSSALSGTFDELAADAPWGDAVGDHASNEELHEALLTQAAALARSGAGFALLSHEVRIMARLLPRQSAWRVESSRRVEHGGHHPELLLLRRV